MLVEANDSAELNFTEANAWEVPCKGDGDDGDVELWQEKEFKIYDQKTKGTEQGKVVFSCAKCS